MMWSGLLLLASGLGAAGAPAHPNSFSISELHVWNGRVEVQLRCQVLSLGEVIEGLDPELDGHAEPGEVDRFAEEIVDYISAHYRIIPGATDLASCADEALALPVAESLVAEAPLALDPMNEVSEWVDVVLRFEPAAGDVSALGVHQSLFLLTSPGHRDSCAVVWNGLELGQRAFALGAESHVFVATSEVIARGEPAVQRYFVSAVGRFASSPEALLLIALFVLAARPGRRSALVSASLMAVAAAIGAQLGARVTISAAEGRFLQLTVPLAIAYIGLDDLLHREGRTRVIEAVIFGLALGGREVLHHAPDLIREVGPVAPLFGLSAGLVVATMGLGVALLALVSRSTESAAAAPRKLRVGADLLAIGAGLGLFLAVALG